MRLCVTILASAVAIGMSFSAGTAQAQEFDASARGKGIAGGALLGAEVVMLTEAVFDVRPAWAYIVGGGIGAVAGGVGGYFFEENTSAKASVLLLAGGMVLAIPTAVAVLSATAYEPPADYTEDRAPDEPVAEPPQPTSSSTEPKAQRVAHKQPQQNTFTSRARLPKATPPTLVDLGDGVASVSVPSVEIGDLYSKKEMAQFGVRQGTEVRVSFLNVLF